MNTEEELKSVRLLEDRGRLIGLIYSLISDILECTKEMERGNTKFHAMKKPGMKVKDYLERTRRSM